VLNGAAPITEARKQRMAIAFMPVRAHFVLSATVAAAAANRLVSLACLSRRERLIGLA